MPTSVRLSAETDTRLNHLAQQTGRTKAFYLREIIERGLDETESYYRAADVLLRVCNGEEAIHSSAEIRADLEQRD